VSIYPFPVCFCSPLGSSIAVSVSGGVSNSSSPQFIMVVLNLEDNNGAPFLHGVYNGEGSVHILYVVEVRHRLGAYSFNQLDQVKDAKANEPQITLGKSKYHEHQSNQTSNEIRVEMVIAIWILLCHRNC